MAESGNWITPILDGEPWFEKPPLLYWLTGIGHLAGLPAEWASRLPLALISLGFLMFFHKVVEREFSSRVALFATAILGTSAGWISYSFAAVTDLPMSAAFGAALLIAMFGPVAVRSREPGSGRPGYMAGVMLGLAILAKGLVPAVLFIPAWLIARGKRMPIIVGSVAVAAPWYIACAMLNGSVFWNEFFWKHHVSRFFESGLEHVQPFWFYLLVLPAALFPWTPLMALLINPRALNDARVRFLLVVVAFGLLFFSVSANKLPGYILPLLPPLALAMAVGFDKASAPGMSLGIGNRNEMRGGSTGWWLGSCALLLAAVPVIAQILPEALRTGLTHTDPAFAVGWPFLILAGAVWGIAWAGQREWAVLTLALSAAGAIGYLKSAAFGPLDIQVSARGFWRANQSELAIGACVDEGVSRDWVYGLNYYLHHPVPVCEQETVRITESDEGLVLRRE